MIRGGQLRMQARALAYRHHVAVLIDLGFLAAAAVLAALSRLSIAARDE